VAGTTKSVCLSTSFRHGYRQTLWRPACHFSKSVIEMRRSRTSVSGQVAISKPAMWPQEMPLPGINQSPRLFDAERHPGVPAGCRYLRGPQPRRHFRGGSLAHSRQSRRVRPNRRLRLQHPKGQPDQHGQPGPLPRGPTRRLPCQISAFSLDAAIPRARANASMSVLQPTSFTEKILSRASRR
jgi:hypothetical protein